MTVSNDAARVGSIWLAPWVELAREQLGDGRQWVSIVNHRDDTAYCLDPAEAEPEHPAFERVVAELEAGGFCAGRPGDERSVHPRRELGIVWRGADRFVRWTHRHGAFRLLTRGGVAVQAVLAMVGLLLTVRALGTGTSDLRAEPAHVPAILMLGLAAVFVHEFGHGLVTVHFGRRVRLAGLRLHLGAPAFYVDSPDALLLDRRQRMLQAAAGPWAEWLATSLVACTLMVLDPGSGTADVVERFLLVNTIGIATNLLPFVGLDGALLFTDAIRRPDLLFDMAVRRGPPTRRDSWVTVYRLLNAVVATGLLVLAGFFWWELFGELALVVWRAGAVGVVVIVALAVLMLRDIGAALGPSLFTACTRARSLFVAARFRLERSWRVEAVNAFRCLPELSSLDVAQLGVLAGLLERHRGVGSRRDVGSGPAYVRRRVHDAEIVATGCVDIDPSMTGRLRDVVVLPGGWRHVVGLETQLARPATTGEP